MIIAQISDTYAFASDRIAIRFGVRSSESLSSLSHFARVTIDDYHGAILQYEPRSEVPVPGNGATISLTEPEARALLEALAAHFGGTGPSKAARDDLLHERGRVDKLIDVMIGLAGHG